MTKPTVAILVVLIAVSCTTRSLSAQFSVEPFLGYAFSTTIATNDNTSWTLEPAAVFGADVEIKLDQEWAIVPSLVVAVKRTAQVAAARDQVLTYILRIGFGRRVLLGHRSFVLVTAYVGAVAHRFEQLDDLPNIGDYSDLGLGLGLAAKIVWEVSDHFSLNASAGSTLADYAPAALSGPVGGAGATLEGRWHGLHILALGIGFSPH